MNYKSIIRQAIDLHVHIGPEIIPRKFSAAELALYEKGKIRGLGVKNHFFPIITGKDNADCFPFLVNSVVLNSYSGGFNSDLIRAVANVSKMPIIVWFPTISAKNFLRNSTFEIPIEWISPKFRGKIRLKKSEEIKKLSIFDYRGEIKKSVKKVLEVIKEKNAILATGHISWQESVALVNYAVDILDIKKIIVTHPIYQKINMPLKIQKKLAKKGAFIEQCYSMYSIDKIPIGKIAGQIKYIGAERCIISSDVGQTFSKSPSEALEEFIALLNKGGIKENEIIKMVIDNPNYLVGGKQ